MTSAATNGTATNATQTFTLLVNRPPVAGADVLSARTNAAATVARLLQNDADPDGDTLSIPSVSGSSAR